MNDEHWQIIEELAAAMSTGGPDWDDEIRMTRAYYDRIVRTSEPQITPGIPITAFGIPVVIDEAVPADPGFRVIRRHP